jgi:hypothetical protein
MHTALWIAAGLLAVVALVGGVSKTFVPKARLAAQPGGEWTAQAPVGLVKGLGVLELLAAAGAPCRSPRRAGGRIPRPRPAPHRARRWFRRPDHTGARHRSALEPAHGRRHGAQYG